MQELRQKIARLIQETGPIPFERFMDLALYDPEYGYYLREETRIGREGDFYTSSHLHPVFGRMIGRQIEEMWLALERPDPFHVIEMGAGEGYVCSDMIGYLREQEMFPALRYCIIERNHAVRKRQELLLASVKDKIVWHNAISGIGTVRGCIFSNELVDAFPVHLVEKKNGIQEIYVGFDGNEFYETPGDISEEEIEKYLAPYIGQLTEGYRTEVNLKAKEWLLSIVSALEEGFVFTIDYGYTGAEFYSEDRARGTFLCYHGHQTNEDPYHHVGEQDMTAHVDFSALKNWGEEYGLKTIGFCPQGTFLIALGIDQEIERISKESSDYLFELARIKKLFMPQGMGESHRVMIQYNGVRDIRLRGFSLRDQTRLL